MEQAKTLDVRYSPPVLAALSILIAVVVTIIWLASVLSTHFGAAPATAGMVILATIPLALLGNTAALLALIFRNENKHVVQYGLWTNGLFAFFAEASGRVWR